MLGVVPLVRESTEPCLTLPKPVELQRLYVHSSQHGTGLAKELVKTAEAQARELGGKNIWLGVWEDNGRGKSFYEKMGFKPVGEHWFWVSRSKRHDWIMQKPF